MLFIGFVFKLFFKLILLINVDVIGKNNKGLEYLKVNDNFFEC